ncbi:MAG: ABC transporter substrate-binding protein, partial [Planctomycetes bacterium]|nr:ABC transporter substrate-binding protein [Planctomycetota bacterium]
AALAPAQAVTTVATPLPSGDGWRAEKIHHADSGIWYAHVDKVVDSYGANEVICADDKGRFVLLTVYSGQWTAHAVTCDGQWLAPTRSADVDPRVPGRELYAAGKGGSVFQVTLRPQPFARFALESREIGHAGGEEFHAIVAADLQPGGAQELLAFAISGAVLQLVPGRDGDAFTTTQVARLPGRVRDVVVVPMGEQAPAAFGVSRSGDVVRMQFDGDRLRTDVVAHEDCGLGRIAVGKGAARVLYVTRDDGVVVRLQQDAAGAWSRSAIYAGEQGLRGIASGRFFADGREAVAVYGYDQVVRMLSRRGDGPWQVETVLATAQKGHWLAVGELDGRNGTDELVATGFDGQVLLLSRPFGYGLPGAAVPAAEPPAIPTEAKRALRIAARLGERAFTELSPLNYRGGFETKSLVYETLVRVGADGRLVPGLASAWRIEDGGRTFVFTLRDGAMWHDGAPVRAHDVALHFRRWAGLPEHGWLRSSARITAVRATGERELRVELDRPAALLADLLAINPTAVAGPATWDREGEFVRPVGSGPCAWLGPGARPQSLRYRATAGGAEFELVHTGDALDALLAGDVDAVVGSWLVGVDPRRAAALRRDSRFQVNDAPGSSVWHLALRWHEGPLAELARRQAVAAAIDRDELVRVAAAGYGDAATGWAAPAFADWPRGKPVVAPLAVKFAAPLQVVAGDADALLVDTVLGQLRRAGIPVELVPGGNAGNADVRFVRTHGAPYDPFTFVETFGRPAATATAATSRAEPVDAALADAVDAFLGAADPATWPQLFARVQARLDEFMPVVPLFAPRRLAVVRQGVPTPALDLDAYRLDAGSLVPPR